MFKVITLSVREFIQNDYYSKASALTFYSLMSIVPILAIAFGIAKGFGFENTLEHEILTRFSEQKEIANRLIQFAYSLLAHAKGGIIAGIGILFLFWSVLTLLGTIENTMNDIWNVREPRSIARRFSDYLAIILICPIVVLISSSLTVFISTQVTETSKSSHLVEVVSPYFFLFLRFSPFVLSWALFSFLYLLVPNTKVSFFTGIVAGILAGTVFQLWQWLYIEIQTRITSYGAIYGSFAALPLFLLWVQYSWLIVLGGAQVAFQIENERSLPSNPKPLRDVSAKVLGLMIASHCIRSFARGERPISDRKLVQLTGSPLNDVRPMLSYLVQGGILAMAGAGYYPARDIHAIKIKDVCDAIDKSCCFDARIQSSDEVEGMISCLNRLNEAAKTAEANIPLLELKAQS